jgi:hypothetical protein
LIRARERGWYDQADDQRCRSLAGYYGNISQMDACVGRVYDALRELGLEKNTVVVYTSDHGEMAGAHRMWAKHNMFEQSVATPLIISMPDRIQSGAAPVGGAHRPVPYPDRTLRPPPSANDPRPELRPSRSEPALHGAGIRLLRVLLLPQRVHAG